MGRGVGVGASRLPLLIEEFQVLYAARRLRPNHMPSSRKARVRQTAGNSIDLVAAAIVVTLRRADEMGDAITARRHRPTLRRSGAAEVGDWVTLAVTLAISGAAVAIETIFHLTR